MKVKSIIVCGLLLFGVGVSTISCEDMFTADNNLVSTDLAPQDTVYQVMGIVKRMQKLADRTVLLGEIRADLVDVDISVASTDIQQLSNNVISTDNVYNKPADYYAVINNCNIYLAFVDSALMKSQNEPYYKREICAVKSFRAWCYLELTKIYGSVPFVTEPVLTADAAEKIVALGSKSEMSEILDFCIQDLQEYAYDNSIDDLRPNYGTTESNPIWGASITSNNLFIPVRALLGELYLWRGSFTGNTNDYIDAIRMYHDYFCFPYGYRNVGLYSVEWADREHLNLLKTTDDYNSRFKLRNGYESEQAGVILCDTSSYYGNTSDLRVVFNSQYGNNYYPWVSPSQRLRAIVTEQDYCFYRYRNENDITIDNNFSKEKNDYSEAGPGDLRFYRVYNTESNLAESQYNAAVNSMKIYISKWLEGEVSVRNDQKNAYVPYFRTTILYLHLAEALNCAGFPETAFAILKYGLTYDVMNNRDIISMEEFNRLCEIKSYATIYENVNEPKYPSDSDIDILTKGSFVIWPSSVFGNVDDAGNVSNTIPKVQIGIHSIGSGRTDKNDKYYLDDEETLKNLMAHEEVPEIISPKHPTAEDTLIWQESILAHDAAVARNAAIDAENSAYLSSPTVRNKRMSRVARLILDEEALEGMFEGLRFYDLMRYQMQQEGILSATITLPAYIEEKYGTTSRMVGKPWYLPLPKR